MWPYPATWTPTPSVSCVQASPTRVSWSASRAMGPERSPASISPPPTVLVSRPQRWHVLSTSHLQRFSQKRTNVLLSLKWKHRRERRPSCRHWWTLLSRWQKSPPTALLCPGRQPPPPSQASGWSTSSARRGPSPKPWVRPLCYVAISKWIH